MDLQGNPQWSFNYEIFLSFFHNKEYKDFCYSFSSRYILGHILFNWFFFFIMIGPVSDEHYWLSLKWYGWLLHIPIPRETYAKSKTCQGPHLLGRQAVKISNNNGRRRREHWLVHSFRFPGWGWAAALWLACGRKCVYWGTCWLWLSLDEGHRSFLVRCRSEIEQ